MWVGLALPGLLACTDSDVHGPAAPVGDATAWYMTIGTTVSDVAWGVDAADDGDVFVATFQGYPDIYPDAWIYRLGPDGTVRWEQTWNSGDSPLIKTFVVKSAGDRVYVGGTAYDGTSNDTAHPYLLALDATTGTLLWSFVWREDDGYGETDGLVVDEAGIYLSGWTTRSQSSNDILLLKLDLDGQLLWSNYLSSPGWDQGDGQLASDDEFLYLSGKYNAQDLYSGGDALLAAVHKTDGSTAWMTTWGEPDVMEDALSLVRDGDALYTVGFAGIQFVQPYRLILSRFDLQGQQQWSVDWTPGGNAFSRSIAIDPTDHSLLVAATSDGAGQGYDIHLLRFSPAGELLDDQLWAGEGDELAHDLVVVGSRAYVTAETESVGAGATDGLVLAFQHTPWVLPPQP
jgi:hypothetical protein